MIFTFRVESGTLIAILLGLVMFGVGYNRLIAYLEKEGYVEGYLSLIVALGVGMTVAPLAILSWQFVAVAIIPAFMASGSPMIVGSISRYLRARKAAQQRIKDEINDNQSKTLAE